MTWYDTGRTVPAGQDESAVVYAELPAGAGAKITAFARLEEGSRIACLWYSFSVK